MKGASLLQENVAFSGFKIYDQGSYPIALDGYDAHSKIIGDIYQLEEKLLKSLDIYEGDEYFRRRINDEGCWIYLGRDRREVEKLPLIINGDWLKYCLW